MILLCENTCLPDCSDWIVFILGLITTILWALYLYSFRPNLQIDIPSISKIDYKSIIVPIKNIKKRRIATRIKVEIAIIMNDNTFHLICDSDDFAFLPPNDSRKFKAYDLNDYLKTILHNNFDKIINYLNESNSFLRVRVHATDSFSGLGQIFEKSFVAIDGDYKKNGFKISI
jgi:hypothetical protein